MNGILAIQTNLKRGEDGQLGSECARGGEACDKAKIPRTGGICKLTGRRGSKVLSD